MLEGHGAEGLLPWLLGVPVLRYGRRGSLPHSSHPGPGLPIGSICPHASSPCLLNEHLLRVIVACHLALAALGERLGLVQPRAAGVRGEPRVHGAQLSSGGGSTECPGGAETPCNGHGTCLDGIDRNGTCVCQVRARRAGMGGSGGAILTGCVLPPGKLRWLSLPGMPRPQAVRA